MSGKGEAGDPLLECFEECSKRPMFYECYVDCYRRYSGGEETASSPLPQGT